MLVMMGAIYASVHIHGEKLNSHNCSYSFFDENTVNHFLSINKSSDDFDNNIYLVSRSKCSSCKGNGKCYYCKGSGKCHTCNGTAVYHKRSCPFCVKGKCKYCSGKGACTHCKGTGYN